MCPYSKLSQLERNVMYKLININIMAQLQWAWNAISEKVSWQINSAFAIFSLLILFIQTLIYHKDNHSINTICHIEKS